jgi:hypothetical protein
MTTHNALLPGHQATRGTFSQIEVQPPVLLGHVCDNNVAQGIPRAFRDAEALGS